ncbi:hypothetical protein M422DRAFT_65598 [Sphaerobolus stellatus SS14]|nr:hypothetical protein M422DRAFT_65598 [Sphaerobolus stellatus SS14]
MRQILGWIILAIGVHYASSSQTPFYGSGYTNIKTSLYDDGLLKPIEDIRILSSDEYTILAHPAYPNHRVRVKQNGASFCDDSVRSYTGYLDIEARHLFFSFFESRSDPKNDDLVLWTNGGPGCSSSIGLYMELGPCRITSANTTEYNPYSWISNANVFFIDQPVGVGFSYADHGESVGTSEEAAKDISAFMRIFLDTFIEFQGRPFHLSGESYGGRYIPTFGAQIYDDNTKAVAAGLAPINLKSLIIGNGITDTARLIPTYYDIQCTAASVEPFQDISACVRMKKAIPRCERLLQESCVDIYDQMGCEAAEKFCQSEIMGPFQATGKNVYDVSRPCEGGMETLCYPITTTIADFLNRPETRAALGVDENLGNYTGCSSDVMKAFVSHLDRFSHKAQFYVAELLERGIDVLIYVGTYDLICNWETFAAQPLRDWTVDGKKAGRTRSFGGLTYATIEGAGHMVPYDKPVEALALVNRWLFKRALEI